MVHFFVLLLLQVLAFEFLVLEVFITLGFHYEVGL